MINNFVTKIAQRGVTLLEIVVTLLVISIGSVAITSLLVNGFAINKTNNQFAENLRRAESCYETILAIHEAPETDKNNNPIQDENDDKLIWSVDGNVTLGPRLSCSSGNPLTSPIDWSQSSVVNDLIEEACGITPEGTSRLGCSNETTSGGEEVTKMNITVNNTRNISLILWW